MIFFLKKMVAKKPFLCYDVSVEVNHRKEGLFYPFRGLLRKDFCYDDCIKNLNF